MPLFFSLDGTSLPFVCCAPAPNLCTLHSFVPRPHHPLHHPPRAPFVFAHITRLPRPPCPAAQHPRTPLLRVRSRRSGAARLSALHRSAWLASLYLFPKWSRTLQRPRISSQTPSELPPLHDCRRTKNICDGSFGSGSGSGSCSDSGSRSNKRAESCVYFQASTSTQWTRAG